MPKVITPISTEPVTLDEAKDHLRITDTAEDNLVNSLITAAREYCEGITRRSFATQTLELMLDSFPGTDHIELPGPPLQSVTSIKYKDSAGVETTMAAADYIVDADSNVGRVVLAYGKYWPQFIPYPSNPIRIRYIAGYYASNLIPRILKSAMLLLIGHWYENREATGSATGQTDFAVNALLAQHKAGWF